jgi:sugar-specific transcriptional regulator TrmB
LGEEIEQVLNELGLSINEVKLYLYLSKSGTQKAIEISKNLQMHKVEVYRFLKNLENKGLVESTLERPIRFAAAPFEEVLDDLISKRRKTITELEERREKILGQWKSMNMEKMSTTSERFVVLSGRENVYLRILNLVRHAQREILGITTDVGLLHGERDGILSQGIAEEAERSRAFPVCARLLTPVTLENVEIAESLERMLRDHQVGIDIRHFGTNTKFGPRLVIKDDDEAVVFLTPKYMSAAGQKETGLWTNSNAVVSALQALFEGMWKESKPLAERSKELRKQT